MEIRLHSLADDRLAPYRALKDRELRAADGRFIAEGRNVVLRLIRSRYTCESILCSARMIESLLPDVPADVPVYVLPDELINQTIGFRFHNGCLAVGRSAEIEAVDGLLDRIGDRSPALLVVAHELNNTENLGSILRIAAGFGAAGVILGPRTADPFYRQAIRVSMGTVFALPLAQSENLVADLAKLKAAGFETLATVLGTDAEPLSGVAPSARTAIVLGSEAHGLDAATIRACDRRVTIPMQLGTDSLNVSIAAAVFMYHLRSAGRCKP